MKKTSTSTAGFMLVALLSNFCYATEKKPISLPGQLTYLRCLLKGLTKAKNPLQRLKLTKQPLNRIIIFNNHYKKQLSNLTSNIELLKRMHPGAWRTNLQKNISLLAREVKSLRAQKRSESTHTLIQTIINSIKRLGKNAGLPLIAQLDAISNTMKQLSPPLTSLQKLKLVRYNAPRTPFPSPVLLKKFSKKCFKHNKHGSKEQTVHLTHKKTTKYPKGIAWTFNPAKFFNHPGATLVTHTLKK